MSKLRLKKEHGYLWGVFNHKCSRCRTGNMFQDKSSYRLKSFMKMNERCPVCEQPMEIEVGFYYGTGYVSYVLAVALSVASLIAWWATIGISLNDNRFFWWMGFNGVLLIVSQPYLMRLSRAIWLSFFVRYNSNWASQKPQKQD
jgi:hypothetical protein